MGGKIFVIVVRLDRQPLRHVRQDPGRIGDIPVEQQRVHIIHIPPAAQGQEGVRRRLQIAGGDEVIRPLVHLGQLHLVGQSLVHAVLEGAVQPALQGEGADFLRVAVFVGVDLLGEERRPRQPRQQEQDDPAHKYGVHSLFHHDIPPFYGINGPVSQPLAGNTGPFLPLSSPR